MVAQQQPSAVSQAFPDLAQHIDPNLPGPHGWPGLKVGWLFTGSILQPDIGFKSECNPAFEDRMNVIDYLGWNAQGSWLLGADYCVYVWNLHSNSLTMMYKAPNEIPAAEFDSMRSPAEIRVSCS
jgi:hypothetical protein